MPHAEQLCPAAHPGGLQSCGGVIHCLLLHIKGIHTAAFAHLTAQPQGIVTVAHGGIHGHRTLLQGGFYHLLRPEPGGTKIIGHQKTS